LFILWAGTVLDRLWRNQWSRFVPTVSGGAVSVFNLPSEHKLRYLSGRLLQLCRCVQLHALSYRSVPALSWARRLSHRAVSSASIRTCIDRLCYFYQWNHRRSTPALFICECHLQWSWRYVLPLLRRRICACVLGKSGYLLNLCCSVEQRCKRKQLVTSHPLG